MLSFVLAINQQIEIIPFQKHTSKFCPQTLQKISSLLMFWKVPRYPWNAM